MGTVIRLNNHIEEKLANYPGKTIKDKLIYCINKIEADERRLTPEQEKQVKLMIQDELFKARQGF